MARVEGVDLRWHALAIAAGIQLVPDLKQLERRQQCSGVADGIVGSVQGFKTKLIARRRHQRRMAKAGNISHFPQTHIGAHGDDTGQDFLRAGVVFDVPIQNVGEPFQKSRGASHKPE